MKSIAPYLVFKTECREAMTFYQKCFGGSLELKTYAEAPPNACPGDIGDKNLIMHAALKNDGFTLLGSDNPSGKSSSGGNIQLSVSCDSREEVDRLFQQLSEGGKALMPLEDTFWGARFGMVADKYGIQWMLSSPH